MGQNHKWVWMFGGAFILAAGVGLPATFAFSPGFDPNRVAAWFTGVLAFVTLLAATAIFAAFGQVREAKKALRDNRAWNRMSAAVTFMPSPELLYRWEVELEGSFVKLISRNDPLSNEEVLALFNPANSGTRILLKSYLNVLEFYALSVNSGLADFDIARRIWGFKILRHFTELKPYIDRSRHLANNKDIYRELEGVCDQWSDVVAIKKPAYPAEP
jgi:hypothetical protein